MGKAFARLGCVLLGLATTLPALADDTEIYFAGGGESGSPNILFVLDASGSMEQAPDGVQLSGGAANPNSRFAIMKNALTTVLNNVQGVNVGLLDYGGAANPGYSIEKARANGIKYPVSPAGPETTDNIIAKINELGVGGYTPIVESLYEAGLYFRGMPSDYGFALEPRRRASLLATEESEAVEERLVIKSGCSQKTGTCENAASAKSYIESLLRQEGVGHFSYEEGSLDRFNCVSSPESVCTGGTDEAGGCVDGGYTLTGKSNTWCSYEYKVISKQKYISPIVNECQQSNIVLLSDGEPDDGCDTANNFCLNERSEDRWVSSKVEELINLAQNGCAAPAAGLQDGRCGEELVDFLVESDQSPELEGDQKVNTFVVGFAVEGAGREYLESLARPPAGNTGFYTANDENALAQALTNITLSIVNRGSSFNPPTVTVDADSGFANSNSVYLPLFEPSRSPRWSGNLKRYELQTSGDTPELVDEDGDPVLDSNGSIIDTARSFWLNEDADPDGGHVVSGGAASLLDSNRNLLTNTESDQLIALSSANVLDTDWFQPVVAAVVEPDEVEAELVEGLTEAEKLRLLQYAQGYDEVTGGDRAAMGDLLHTRPVVVNYGHQVGNDEANENADDAQNSLAQSVVFTGTNEGYLHAIRASDGKELFAFMPRMLLPNLNALYANSSTEGVLGAAEHPYGVDGPIVAWRNDVDGDGIIEPDYSEDLNDNNTIEYTEREFVWLIFGLRRGGNAYYALDVSDPVSPEMKWVIRDTDSDYAALGQSWSAPIRTMLNIDNDPDTDPVPAVIIGGGYDVAQDDQATRTPDTVGNAVFAVDPDTGTRLWWASNTGADLNIGSMTNSIPANVRVIDIDNNDVADRIYAADTGGRIFRIDLPDPSNQRMPQADLIVDDVPQAKGILLADLSADGDVAENRRFYYEPDVSILNASTGGVAAIAIGSGFRAHPLLKDVATSQDRLYVLRDRNLYSVPTADTPAMLNASLTDATSDYVSQDEGVQINDAGWYLDLDQENGEKALARAVTFNNTVFFTTFIPETTAAADVCSYASHTGGVYALNVKNADPVIRFSDVDNPDLPPLGLADRKTAVSTADILSEVYFNVSSDDEGKPVVDAFIGARFDKLLSRETLEAVRKIYWQEETSF